MSLSATGFEAQFEHLGDALVDAARRVFSSGWYVLGAEVEAFEREFAEWVGVPHTVGVASGSDALQLALAALGVGQGDEVIVPSNALPTAYGVAATGATLRFADARLDDLNIDPVDVERLLTPATRAVVATHLYGHPADVAALREVIAGRDIHIIEDCAQAHGARFDGRPVGTLSDVAAWSFYPTKNLGGFGDGGAVTCRDDALAARIRSLRTYGEERRYYSTTLGINSRLDELQAALLRTKLPHLGELVQRRQHIAARYDEMLSGVVQTPPCLPLVTHARHLYPVRVDDRDAVLAALQLRDIPAAIHYPTGAHGQPCFAGSRDRSLPVTEMLGASLLSLPIHPFMSDEDVSTICEAVVEVVGASAATGSVVGN